MVQNLFFKSQFSHVGGRFSIYLWDLPWFWPLYSPSSSGPFILYEVSIIHGYVRKRCAFTRKSNLSLSFTDTKSDPWLPQAYRVGKRSGKRVGTWISNVETLYNLGSGCTRLTEAFIGSSRLWGGLLIHGGSASSRQSAIGRLGGWYHYQLLKAVGRWHPQHRVT